jgi:hypothetical protein
VRDAQGAAVAGAEVKVTEETTGQVRTVVVDEDGFYTVPSLPVGRYTVAMTAQGFKTTVAPAVAVNVNTKVVVDVVLEAGGIDETVTVTDAAQLVETQEGSVSSLISEKQVKELPLNGRNYAQLALMVPGVSPVTGTSNTFQSRGTGLNAGVDMSVNGNGSNTNMWTVDGVNNMDVGSNRTLLVFPSIDAIQEFRVERNSFSAEFGQAQGAVINLVTKGGGNEFHGTAFEFLRNDALNATPFFLNQAGQEKGPLRYNNFGFNFSGPIIKDRIFFFWSEEWRRERRGFTLSGRVPTAAERIGDFSGPLTGPAPHLPGQSTFYPGNRIPQDQLSPAGLALLSLYPLPNVADPSAPGNNFFSSPVQPIDTRQDLIRGDIVINDKTNLMVRWINENWTHSRASGSFWGDSPFPTLSSDWDQPSFSFAVKLTNQLGDTAVNEFQFSRAGNNIFIETSPETQAARDAVANVFPTVFPHDGGVVPGLFWGNQGYTDLWHQAPWENHEDLYIWKDDFSLVVGEHTLKMGALFSHNIKDEQQGGAGGGNGLASIQGGGVHTGNVIADLLIRDLPLVNYTEIDNFNFVPGRWHDLEFYFNDSWKIHPRVTLNLGMRYSRFAQAYANDDNISNYIPRLYDGVDPLSGLVLATEAEAQGIPRSLVDSYNKGFQPRIGVAWDVYGDGKLAVRGGFGRYMGRANVIEDILRLAGNPPWTTTVDTGWGGSGETSTLADCPTCRSLDTINPGLAGAVAGVGPNTGFAAVDEEFRPPESWQWNLSVSREILPDTVLEVSYVGNNSDHIWRRNVDWNQVLPENRQAIADILRQGGDAAALISESRRFPGVGPITMSMSNGESNYHGLQVWLNRRFSNRLAYQASYTWGHAISNVPLTSFVNSASDIFNLDLDRGDADLDRRHTFVGNVVYVLPSFERFGDVGRWILGDWQINGIVSYYSGTPIDIVSGANTGGLNTVPGRVDLVPGVDPYFDHDRDPLTYLNPAAFALPPAGRFGTLRRGEIRAPEITNVDASLTKNFPWGERFNIQFRAEFFNLFNHTNFNGWDANINLQNNITDANFGRSTNANFGRLTNAQGPREIQFGLKFSF